MNIILTKIKLQAIKVFDSSYFYIMGISVFLILAFGTINFLWPSLKQIKDQGQFNLLSAIDYEKRLQVHLDELKGLNDQYTRFSQKQIEKLKLILPKETDYPGIFIQFQDLAQRNNLVLDSISLSLSAPEAQAKKGENNDSKNQGSGDEDLFSMLRVKSVHAQGDATIRELTIAITVHGGGYEDFKKFLSEVEYNQRLLDVTSISFESVETGPYTLNLRTYFF